MINLEDRKFRRILESVGLSASYQREIENLAGGYNWKLKLSSRDKPLKHLSGKVEIDIPLRYHREAAEATFRAVGFNLDEPIHVKSNEREMREVKVFKSESDPTLTLLQIIQTLEENSLDVEWRVSRALTREKPSTPGMW